MPSHNVIILLVTTVCAQDAEINQGHDDVMSHRVSVTNVITLRTQVHAWTSCGHFIKYASHMYLGIPQCISAQPAAAGYVLQSTDQVRTVVQVRLNHKRGAATRMCQSSKAELLYYASGCFQLFMSLSLCDFPDNPQHASQQETSCLCLPQSLFPFVNVKIQMLLSSVPSYERRQSPS